jgi:hypothetical protein
VCVCACTHWCTGMGTGMGMGIGVGLGMYDEGQDYTLLCSCGVLVPLLVGLVPAYTCIKNLKY